MKAEEFLKNKGIGKPTINAVRLPHKYNNDEFELVQLLEEYHEAKLKLLNLHLVDCQRELLPSKYDIDFGGHCKAGINVTEHKIEVVGAINGYGDSINMETITISKYRQ